MSGIRFTDEFKRDAVAQVVDRGYSVHFAWHGMAWHRNRLVSVALRSPTNDPAPSTGVETCRQTAYPAPKELATYATKFRPCRVQCVQRTKTALANPGAYVHHALKLKADNPIGF
jgi:transposase-like protein